MPPNSKFWENAKPPKNATYIFGMVGTMWECDEYMENKEWCIIAKLENQRRVRCSLWRELYSKTKGKHNENESGT